MKSSTRKNSNSSNPTEASVKYRVMRSVMALLMGLAAWPFGTAQAAPQAPLVWTDAETGLEFVWVAPGCFDMGASAAKPLDQYGAPGSPRQDEVPKHRVCVDGYWMGRYEVTRGQWQRIMGQPASPATAEAQRPMVNVSWQAVQQFLQRLNARAAAGERFRLPTEAEWEYACQPGEPQSDIDDNRWGREDELKVTTWFRGNKRGAEDASEVGSLGANPRGLHDMLGNVWEWVDDSYRPDAYQGHASKNPRITEAHERKVLRGGSFRSDIHQARCGARAFGLIDDGLTTVGLRLVGEKIRP